MNQLFKRMQLFLLVSLLSGLLFTKTNGQAKDGLPAEEPVPVSLDAPLRFERFSLEDGLSQNSVLSLLQDKSGFLWIGTQDGLNRYDGYSFTVFKHDAADSTTISHNSILCLFEDSESQLWIGTWGGGLNRYDPRSGIFIRYLHDPEKPDSLGGDLVADVHEDSRGRLWVATQGGGLDLLDRETGKFTHYTHDPENPTSLSSNDISVIYEDRLAPEPLLWVGTGGFGAEGSGLNRFDPQTGQATRYFHDEEDPESLSTDSISSIQQDITGNIWIGAGGYALAGSGLNRLDPQTGKVTRYQHSPTDPASLSSNDIMSLYLDRSGLLWIGTWGGGLDVFDTSAGVPPRFVHQVNDVYNDQSLSSDVVWPVLEDQSGLLWVGTVNGGLNKMNPQVQRFRLYQNSPDDSTSLGFNVVGPILEARSGVIYIGTMGGGLDTLDRQSGAFSHWTGGSQQVDSIMSLHEDPDGALWVGSLDGLRSYDPITRQVTTFRHDPANPGSLVDNNVSGIVRDASQRLWVGTLGGLDWYDPETGRFVHIVKDGLAAIVSMKLDPAGYLWVGTWGNGAFRLDPSTVSGSQVEAEQFVNDPQDPSSLSNDSVWAFHPAQGSRMWIGTSYGLNLFDPSSSSSRRYTEKEGLANNSVLCILEDASGKLWISTNDGLSVLNVATSTFRSYDSGDGLQSNEFNSGACAQAWDGQMFFGGIHGLNQFAPQLIQDNAVPPPVAITSFSIYNEPVSVDLSGSMPLELSYRQNFIAFEFSGLDFHDPESNTYTYQLEGYDRSWVNAGTRRYASYTDLPGGQYTFRVKASNSDGAWNLVGASIPLVITPPFWAAWWFWVSAAALVLGLAAGGVAWRLELVRQQNRRLENLVSDRTHELQQTTIRLESETEQRIRAEQALAARAEERLVAQQTRTHELEEINLRLEQEMEQRQRAEQALAQKAAEEAVVNERNRLARDLHDAVTQTLFSASLLAEVIPELWNLNPDEAYKRLEELRQLARGALAEMRTLLLELRPSALTDTSLPDLLRQLTEAIVGRARIPVELIVDGDCCTDAEIQVALYRIAQEALNNVAKYSKATQVSVLLHLAPDSVRLSVLDNGIGFDPARVPANHLGLRIMRERAEAIGARFAIYSEPGEGAQVTVSLSR
jgi:signal transduction histidine kinase/ligand-binding sensor domain-containing protein